jgi:DNA polymerase-3 subunit delta
MVVACKLPEGAEFRLWLQARCLARGKTLEPEVADLLAARTEGNLLAAAQEIDLLMLLVDDATITLAHALAAVSDSARYDVYKVVDSALEGDIPRAVRMLRGVRDEGSDAIVIGWSAGRELRILNKAATARNVDAVFSAERVWSSRQPLLRRALQRQTPARLEALLRESVRIDQVIKGMGEGDPWEALESLLIALAGGPALGLLAESTGALR